MQDIKELLNTVVENDYCIGCGVCASIIESPLTMKMDANGKYKPILIDTAKNMEINTLSVCPFAKENNKETEIGKEQFGQNVNIKFDEFSGYYLSSYAGYVKEGNFRLKGSSGGMGNWIASKLLEGDKVDGIIHVKSTDEKNGILFDYQISKTIDELSEGAKSKYYPIEMSEVLQYVKENEGRYALIGIPCYLKAVRLLAKAEPKIKDRIKFMIGLVCGHLKSDMFAKSIGWQMGIQPDNLNEIDFRKKLEEQAANNYGVEVKGEREGEIVELSSPTRELYTTNWGQGMFKYNACEFCDDVLAETADVTVGDAWLPEYSKDSKGTNVIVVRNPIIQRIIEENIGVSIHLDELNSEKVYQSQAGGFRHRRDGLAYRLHLKDKNNEWRPNKRVYPNGKISTKRKRIYEMRTLLSQESFKAYKVAEREKDFNVFIDYMDPLVKEYNKLNTPSFARKVFQKVKREVKKLLE